MLFGHLSSSKLKWLLLILAAMAAGYLFVICLNKYQSDRIRKRLPTTNEIKSIRVIPNTGWNSGLQIAIPEFELPEKYNFRIVNLFQLNKAEPASTCEIWPWRNDVDSPMYSDDNKMITLELTLSNGKNISICAFCAGKSPLRFTVNGIRLWRGGQYAPVGMSREAAIDGKCLDESLQLYYLFYEIYHETLQPGRRGRVFELFDDFARSRGEIPAKAIGKEDG